jgi:cell division protein FtsQ
VSAQGLLRSLRASAPHRRAGTRPRRRTLAVLAVALCAGLLTAGWLWFRDSSLVAVERVTVTGVRGPDAGPIRAALVAAARGMTTLDVRAASLRAAVSSFPNVADIRVSAKFPHTMRIVVTERTAVAKVMVGSQAIALAADGTVLRDAGTAALPAITLRALPGGDRVTDPGALAELAVLAAAPRPMLGRIASIRSGYWHGVVVQLHNGPHIYFGDASRPQAKWRAVLAVLATPQVAGSDYVDVTDPDRAAAGLDAPPASLTAPPAGTAPNPTGQTP